MKLFITLLENVNKSRTSAGNLSLNGLVEQGFDENYFFLRQRE
jgi:hypothetical protein